MKVAYLTKTNTWLKLLILHYHINNNHVIYQLIKLITIERVQQVAWLL